MVSLAAADSSEDFSAPVSAISDTSVSAFVALYPYSSYRRAKSFHGFQLFRRPQEHGFENGLKRIPARPPANRRKTRRPVPSNLPLSIPSWASVEEAHGLSKALFEPAVNLSVSQFQNLVQTHLLVGRKNSQHMRCDISNCLDRPSHTDALPRKFLSPQTLDDR